MRGDTLLLRNADLLCTMNLADSSAATVRAGDNVGNEIRNGGLFARGGVIEVDSPEPLQVSAYLNRKEDGIVVVVVNPSKSAHPVTFSFSTNMKVKKTFQTDRNLNCEEIDSSIPISPSSVRTFVFGN